MAHSNGNGDFVLLELDAGAPWQVHECYTTRLNGVDPLPGAYSTAPAEKKRQEPQGPKLEIEGMVTRISEPGMLQLLKNVPPFLRQNAIASLGNRRTEISILASDAKQYQVCADLKNIVLTRGSRVRAVVDRVRIRGIGPTFLCKKLSVVRGSPQRNMNHQPVNTRNEPLEFARRTRRNLEFIERAKEEGECVHVVTQLTISLLGLVVFPKEKLLLNRTKTKTIENMRAEGWPSWTITLDNDWKNPTRTLYDILRHLRNAVAHGRVTFTSDSGHLQEVAIIVEDKKQSNDPQPCWRAEIDGEHLRGFCLRLIEFIDSTFVPPQP